MVGTTPVLNVNERGDMFGFVSSAAVPVPCSACGYDRSKESKSCSGRGLRNHRNFPPFLDLPGENDLDEDFYREGRMGVYEPSRHWCLVGEVEDFTAFMRMRVQARTRFGERFMIHFHLDQDEGGVPKFFDLSAIQPHSSTICILYPYIRHFMDGSIGVRQESCGTIMVFSAPLDQLSGEVDKILSTIQNPKACVMCGEGGCGTGGEASDAKEDAKGGVADVASTGPILVRPCSRCKILRYCGKECQTKHWGTGHKRLCGHASTLLGLAQCDFNSFQCHQDWNFSSRPLSPAEDEHRCKLIQERTIAKMRPAASLANLRDFLEHIGDRVLAEDPISAPICQPMGLNRALFKKEHARSAGKSSSIESCEYREGVKESGFFRPVKEHFLHKALLEMCDLHMGDRGIRHHAVDMRTPLLKNGKEEPAALGLLQPLILEALFLAFPLWQRDLGMRGVWWSFDVHDVFLLGGFAEAFGKNENDAESKKKSAASTGGRSKKKGADEAYAGKDGWSCTVDVGGGIDLGFAIHERANIRTIYSDSLGFSASSGESVGAVCKRDGIVVRVLRATGNASRREEIVKALRVGDGARANKKSGTETVDAESGNPDNVFTLWIREDVAVCGCFEAAYDLKKPLKTQLLAAMRVDPIQQMSGLESDGGVKKKTTHGGKQSVCLSHEAPAGGGAGRPLKACSACGMLEDFAHDGTFSNSQRKLKDDIRRCTACIDCGKRAGSRTVI